VFALPLGPRPGGIAVPRPVEPVAARRIAPPAVVPAPRAPAPPPPPALARVAAPPPPPAAPVPDPAALPLPPGSPAPVIDEGYPVSLERLRAELPRNRYWIDSAP